MPTTSSTVSRSTENGAGAQAHGGGDAQKPRYPALFPYVLSKKELLSGDYPTEKERIDVALFHDIPFFAFSKTASTGRYMADMLGYYSAASHDVLNARHSGVQFNMMCAGLGAILTSDSSVKVASLYYE